VPAKEEEEKQEVVPDDDSELKELIKGARQEMNKQAELANDNLNLIDNIEKNKGIVVKSTQDFQETCMVILNREAMLKSVVKEISKHHQHYKD